MLNYLRIYLLQISVMFMVIVSLLGCEAPKKNNNTESFQDAQYLTGVLNENGIPYVKDPLLVYDEEDSDESNIISEDKKFKLSEYKYSLSVNIKNINAYRFAHKINKLDSVEELKRQSVNFGSESIIIQIETLNEVVQQEKFQYFLINKFEKKGHVLHFRNVAAVGNAQYLLSGEISDSEKEDSYFGKYEIIFNKSSKAILKTKIYQRFYFANVHISEANEKNTVLMSEVSANLKSGNLFAAVSNWTVVGGPAFRNIKIISDLRKKSPSISQYSNEEIERLKIVTEFSSPSIRTAGLSPEGYPVFTSEENKVSLLGLDEATGEQFYVVSDKDQRIYLEVNNILPMNSENLQKKNNNKKKISNLVGLKSENEQSDNNGPLLKNSRNSFFQAHIIETDSFSNKVVRDLDRNLKVQKVRDIVSFWTHQTNKKPYKTILDRKSILNFFKNIKPLENQLLRIFSSYKLPPEVSFISLVENKFFTSDDYSYLIVNKKSTASGMYQILKETGMRFGLLVDQNQRIGEAPDLKDERLYFYPASCSVAKMMHNYVNNFQGDATFAFLAYRLGENKAASILECSRTADNKAQCGRRQCTLKTCSGYLKIIKNSNMKYAQIVKYNILPLEISNWINQILAAYFISQDLAGYGIIIDKLKVGPQDKVLMPPNGYVSDQKCRQIVSDFE